MSLLRPNNIIQWYRASVEMGIMALDILGLMYGTDTVECSTVHNVVRCLLCSEIYLLILSV